MGIAPCNQPALITLSLPHRTPYPGGAPANVATGVARLGAGALFISAIGQDDLGDDFVGLLQSENYLPLSECRAGWGGAGCPALIGSVLPFASSFARRGKRGAQRSVN